MDVALAEQRLSPLVRAGELSDDTACKPFRALRLVTVRYACELAALAADRRSARDGTLTRQPLRDRWTQVASRLGTAYRNARGKQMSGWVVVASMPSYRVRRLLAKWAKEIPRAVLPN